MKNKFICKRSLLILLLIFLAQILIGCGSDKPTIKFEDFKVILPPSVASGTAAYGVIINSGSSDDTLIDVTSNAGNAMLHITKVQSGVAEMLHVPEYTIEPKSNLVLKPMSYHIMLTNIDHSIIKENGDVLLSFEFKKSGKIKINVPVFNES